MSENSIKPGADRRHHTLIDVSYLLGSSLPSLVVDVTDLVAHFVPLRYVPVLFGSTLRHAVHETHLVAHSLHNRHSAAAFKAQVDGEV